MGETVRKRRRLGTHAQSSDDVADDQVRELLRKHFERSFAPLPRSRKSVKQPIEPAEVTTSTVEDEFEGFDTEDEEQVTTVEFDDIAGTQPDRVRSKDFMVCSQQRELRLRAERLVRDPHLLVSMPP